MYFHATELLTLKSISHHLFFCLHSFCAMGFLVRHISNLRSGAAKTFYEGYTYQQLSLCVRIVEDTSLHKTIHKAKGDEFR